MICKFCLSIIYIYIYFHLFIIIIKQEEYRGFTTNIVDNVIELVDVFREYSIPIFWSWWDRTPNDGISNAMDRYYGPEGIDSNKNALYIFGKNGKNIIPEIEPKTDIEKKRCIPSNDLNLFWNFDDDGNSILDKQLNELNIDTIIIIGAWTEQCVLSTAFNAYSRNYDTIIISDAVDTVTPYHSAALDILSTSCCKIIKTKEIINYIKNKKYKKINKKDL